jgi:putative oligomerization/nucleic acid binding protein/phospholipase D-like protein
VTSLIAEFGTGQAALVHGLVLLGPHLDLPALVVFGDIFRSDDIGGWGKTLWVIFIIVLPYLGVVVYLIARGHKMQEHAVEAAQKQDAAMRTYVQSVATVSPADELAKLADLKAKGVIDDAEYERLKTKALA